MHLVGSSQPLVWSTGMPQPLTGSLQGFDISKHGPATLRSSGNSPSGSWSFGAWISLDGHLEHAMDVTALSYGPVSLKFAAPGVPYLVSNPHWPDTRRRFSLLTGIRGHCGDMSLPGRRTSSDEDAAMLCATTPGCQVFTRDIHSHTTVLCYSYYAAETHDINWHTGLLWDPPPLSRFEQAVAFGQWNYYLVTYSAAAGLLRLYKNGFLLTDLTGQQQLAGQRPAGWLDLGASAVRHWEARFPGRIANLQLWAEELQPNQAAMAMYGNLPQAGEGGPAQLLNAAPSGPWPDLPLPRSGWRPQYRAAAASGAVGGAQRCAAAVVIPVTEADAQLGDLRAAAVQLQHYAGAGCQVHVYYVAYEPPVQRHPPPPPQKQQLLQQSGAPAPAPPPQPRPSLREQLRAITEEAGSAGGGGSGQRIEVVEAPAQQQQQQDSAEAATGGLAAAWNAGVRAALERIGTQHPDLPYVMLAGAQQLPTDGWLAALVEQAEAGAGAGAGAGADAKAGGGGGPVGGVHAKVIYPNGTVQAAGISFQVAYHPYLDRQAPGPVETHLGYPFNYAPIEQPYDTPAAGCSALLLRAALLRELVADGALGDERLGGPGNWPCLDLSLRLRKRGQRLVVAPGAVLVSLAYNRTVDGQADGRALGAFLDAWGPQLEAEGSAALALTSTATWVMHCGGSMGIEAANLVQHMEGRLRLRAQVQRGSPWCEHADVLQGTPRAFADRVGRLRQLSAYLPSDIYIHHKDYRQLAAWPWPPNNSSAYLIGRYMWEVDRVHAQWSQQMIHELDEVWVPSRWHADSCVAQGVPASKVFVVPESLDAALYNPDITDPVALPGRRRVAFLAVFKLEDRKGWQTLLTGYLKAFRDVSDVSLYIHTVTYPNLSYRRDWILDTMNNYLRGLTDTYLNATSLYPTPSPGRPHIHVFGQHLSGAEMVRIYSSIDCYVLPSHGEGWGLPYLEAMALGKPVIATGWSGMTEFLNPRVAYVLNYTLRPVHTSDPWFQGAKWAEPSEDSLVAVLREAYANPRREAMGAAARAEVVAKYDNAAVGRNILERLQKISAQLAAAKQPRQPRSLDISKDPVPIDLHMCALAPRLPRAAPPQAPAGAIRLAVATTWAPRPCGIATFTDALLRSLRPLLPPGSQVDVFPIILDLQMPANLSDPYPPNAIRQYNYGDYVAAAAAINAGGYNVAMLQYEFGIYGGTHGSYANCFAKLLRVPVVSVIHTLSDNLPDEHHYNLQNLAGVSDSVVVMSPASRNKLGAYHGIPGAAVAVLPHGVPRVPQVNVAAVKASLNLTGRTVLITNGLIHPGKGIDLVLQALPEVVAAVPNLLYLVVGEPHPGCKQTCLDHYKHLQAMAAERNLTQGGYVRFVTQFLDEDTMMRYIQASDVYVLPYRDRITTNSGTLSMAMAAGKVVVSTPFEHAAVALIGGRGVLFDFDDWRSLRDALLGVLGDFPRQAALSKAAREYASGLEWSDVAAGYLRLLTNVTTQASGAAKPAA
ncbi:hypothetical protein HYH02_014601 [Chlamydomonas schloesseri]|uniref:Glycosyl transferase family 1 domain-containing protein n=1 Tax=Chlamydomonas schloesseri TaxID=2026947 RepID=A0A835SKT1_9CHLO|nr:hypothetical protein HYH02_014601 [Chlamydomonas schloesseri]|eukprot:KAG2427381.1 hypothetical protein HYH02_014601 [Chlamydomonas schloesseri]